VSPAGCAVRVTSTRLVSFTQRAVAAIWYEVEPVDSSARVVVQSELVANESLPDVGRDPRAAAALESPLVLEENVVDSTSAAMVHVTRRSRQRVAAAMDHEVHGPEDTQISVSGVGDVARFTVAAQLGPGQPLRLVKFLAYGWSSQRSRPALHDQVVAAVAAARMRGWDGLVEDQRDFLERFWNGADVELDGDADVQQAVRFGLFHVLQAGARAEQRPIPAKGLTGPGYDGHVFWDTETFVLPTLTYTYPQAAADALRWRQTTLPIAKEHADRLGLDGACFPWRTIAGEECSGYWPAGTAAFHVNADIADAALRYVDATEDRGFERETVLPLVVATARLWRSLGHHDLDGRFRIDGVTGPDEYSALADNNVYTNLMAARNLSAAADLVGRYADDADGLGVSSEEAASWRDAAATIVIPYDHRLKVHPQAEGFTDHARWDFEHTRPEQYPLLLNFPYFDLYRKQVVKQADLVLALHLRGERFTAEEKARDFAYYEPLTVRDSSLSACTQAVMAAEVGQLDLAYDYLGEAALMDLDDLEHNTRDGLHMASLAGTWTALVAGLGGMRAGTTGAISFAPRLPGGISRLSFRMFYRDRRIQVSVTPDAATYRLLSGAPLSSAHHGESIIIHDDRATYPIPGTAPMPRPRQPTGREPISRHVRGTED
jgi:alpha,alpha-trehalose phosphorylase